MHCTCHRGGGAAEDMLGKIYTFIDFRCLSNRGDNPRDEKWEKKPAPYLRTTSSDSTWVRCGTRISEYLCSEMPAEYGNHDANFPTSALKRGGSKRENLSLLFVGWVLARSYVSQLLLNKSVERNRTKSTRQLHLWWIFRLKLSEVLQPSFQEKKTNSILHSIHLAQSCSPRPSVYKFSSSWSKRPTYFNARFLSLYETLRSTTNFHVKTFFFFKQNPQQFNA